MNHFEFIVDDLINVINICLDHILTYLSYVIVLSCSVVLTANSVSQAMQIVTFVDALYMHDLIDTSVS